VFVFLAGHIGLAQFTSSQKDSVLNALGYGSVDYRFTIFFKPFDYSSKVEKNTFENQSEKEILDGLSNTYKDASRFQYLCLLLFKDKKDLTKVENYFNKAIEKYQLWIDKEPKDPTPYIELLALFYGTQTYKPLSEVLDEALNKFPENIDLLEFASLLSLDLYKDFEKTKSINAQIFKLEPYNLSACTYQLMIYQYQFILAMSKGGELPKIDISIAEEALKANPQKVGYQHLLHFAKVGRGYLNCAEKFYKESNATSGELDYGNMFNGLTEDQKKEFKAAETFFKTQVNKQKKARLNILNSLGFVCLYLNKRADALNHFQLYYDESQSQEALENLILLQFLNKNWSATETLLETSISKFNSINGYSSLMGIFSKYKIDLAKQQATIKRVEDLTTQDETKNILLATWHLKNKNVEKASHYCGLLTPQTESSNWRYFALSVLQDNRENADVFLKTILAENPSDEDALKLKRILNL
jgi:hypothetical protein